MRSKDPKYNSFCCLLFCPSKVIQRTTVCSFPLLKSWIKNVIRKTPVHMMHSSILLIFGAERRVQSVITLQVSEWAQPVVNSVFFLFQFELETVARTSK